MTPRLPTTSPPRRRRHGIPAAILFIGIVVLLSGLDSRTLALTGNRLESVPENLDTLLDRALAANPEIIVQEAVLEEAIAGLNRTRLAVTQEVVSLHFKRKELRGVVRSTRQSNQRLEKLRANGSVSGAEVEQGLIDLARAEGELARVEAELRYSIGAGGIEGGRRGNAAALLTGPHSPASVDDEPEEPGRPPIPAAVAQKIDGTKLRAEFVDQDLVSVLEFIASATGTNLVLDPEVVVEEWMITLTLPQEVTVRQLFQALADTYRICFFFRDYGVYVTVDEDWSEAYPRIPAVDW